MSDEEGEGRTIIKRRKGKVQVNNMVMKREGRKERKRGVWGKDVRKKGQEEWKTRGRQMREETRVGKKREDIRRCGMNIKRDIRKTTRRKRE